MELNSNEKQFIDDIASQLTELYYGLDTWEETSTYDRVYSEEAQEMYDGKYDEWKTYYINLKIDNYGK